ncbi:cation diffusion facilitator family transporter [Histidinibacterium lentulum]|uniref:Protein p34 n=1 Tax=Histidinibacterium lentulum TaxID=2480588 RepID=A0A3N2QR75_9RHOB|nr:cation diffusion facilitator family transporter [Histidinibacterium lentulum]ROT97707.1 cation transporter [Histidinibacterium lentulum]
MSAALKLAIGSLAVGLVVLGLKTLAWWLTGSVALLSDALESTVNLATAFAALVAIRVAARPADSNHPFGHHKAEFFSAALEGAMIIVAAVFILREAWAGLLGPRALEAPLEGLLINGVATALNAAWATVLLRRGRSLRSPALVADGRHLWTDVLTSVGVVAGVLLAWGTGLWILDPLLAALVALNILWSGWRVMTSSLSGLMDEAVPEETLARLREIIATEGSGAVEAHDLRTRHAGSATFVEFHLVVPSDMTVFQAHEICDRLEAAIARAIPGVRATIHVEPEHKSKPKAIVVLD